jgi:tetratricopeptide (TPR) repeat protein
MNKENVLFGVVGLLAGLIIGFMATNSINKSGGGTSAADMKQNSNIPPGHPEIPGGGGQSGATGGMQPEVQEAIAKAKQSPDDFAAQSKAAEMYYQIERFDDAITYLKAANKLKPDDRETIVHLGDANFDGDHFEEAEKWYTQALAKKADDVSVRTDLGLTFFYRNPPNYDRAIQEYNRSLEIDPNHLKTLQNLTVAYIKKGDSAKASATLAKLENIDPSNKTIADLKSDIAKIGSK